MWLVKKALDGLRQSPRCWGQHRDQYLKQFRAVDPTFSELTLVQAQCDTCVLVIKADHLLVGWLLTYVDDILAVAKGTSGRTVIGHSHATLEVLRN